MGRDEAAELDHDLGVMGERDRADGAVPAPAVDPRAHGPVEAGEPPRRERLAPDREQVGERGLRGELDDAGRVARADGVAATGAADVQALDLERRRHPDAGRQEQGAAVREQLDVRLVAAAVVGAAVEAADRRRVPDDRRGRRKLELRAGADRRRDGRRGDGERDEGTGQHARPSLPRLLALVVVAIVALFAGTAARADGDPASDVLPTEDVYLPVAQPSGDAAAALTTSVAAVFAGGDRIKVAVIATQDDMGAVTQLFNQQQDYAKFLSIELAGFYVGPLLIVMPGGFGYYDGGRPTTQAQGVLSGMSVNRASVDTLVRSAAAAVDRLRTAGALHSPDVKAPLGYPGIVVLKRGALGKLSFRLFDDSERAGATLTVLAGARTVASLKVPLQQVSYSKTLTLPWKAPKTLPKKGVRLCVVAVDGAGNASPRACASARVR
jgi:hypothetical protein